MTGTVQGIDCSRWQGIIDWPKLASRARFAFIKMAEGTSLDPRGAINWAQSKGKLPRGAYCFFHPEVDALLQAHTLVNACGSDLGELPFVVDVEAPATAWSQAMRDSLRTCLEGIEQLCRRKPILYTGSWFWPYVGNAPWAAEYPLWIAQYVDGNPAIPALWKSKGHLFWQYSSIGNGPDYGCTSQAIDLNQFKGDEAAWAAYIGKEDKGVSNIIHITNGVKSIDFSSDDTITITTIPAPLPPPSTPTWDAQWFNNETLTGNPTYATTYPDPLSLQLGNNGPGGGIGIDGFSGRFITSKTFTAGEWEVAATADDGVRVWIDGVLFIDKWVIQAPATYKAHMTLTAGAHNIKVEYFEHAGGALLAVSFAPYVPPPLPPPTVVTMRLNGIHTMQFSGEAARADGCMAFVALDNNDELRRLAAMGHQCWFRKWIGDAALTPQQVIDNTPNLGEKESWFAKNPVGLILSNERDTGMGKLTYIQQAQWEKAAIKYGVQTRGFKCFAVGTYPMGTPDVTNPQVRADLSAGYRDMLNSQTADGVAAIIDLDLHNYVPNFDKWLYATNARYMQVTDEEYSLTLTTRRTKKYRDGETPREYTTTHVIQPNGRSTALATAANRVLNMWDWYLTRFSFWFWPEYGIGLDPAKVKVIASETGEDEGGVGGCKAHNRSTADVRRAMLRMLDLLSAPLVMDVVTGKTAPSPFYAGCWFQMGDNVRWAGYSMTDYVNSHGLGADAYKRMA